MADTPPKKQRADQALVDRGLVETRTRAQALILAGRVYSSEQRIEKPGQVLRADQALEVRGQDHPWVSRGGVKLDHALGHFGLSPAGLVCLDIGASTGGFTDVLLHHGAARVVAVDVGHGQLAWRLRNDPRVTVLERVNARYLEAAQLPPGAIGALVCDASFIGLQTLLPAPLGLCAPGAWAVALIKPQFEVGPAVAKGGVVRDAAVHRAVCDRIAGWWRGLPGWTVLGVEASPLLGPEGNREFLIAARRADAGLDKAGRGA
jgi:23S rRNA (cytidine1920-2'-O)/16S rRNA (cytidine1409-2'-O)-methyltransferase